MSKHKKKDNSTFYFFLFTTIIVAFFFFWMIGSGGGGDVNSGSVALATTNGNTQYIDVTAKGGYSPSFIEAKANTDTTLRITSKNTFDCSLAFSIPKLNIRKNLPTNGTTEIALGKQNPGTELTGTCSMGMYRFTMKFV